MDFCLGSIAGLSEDDETLPLWTVERTTQLRMSARLSGADEISAAPDGLQVARSGPSIGFPFPARLKGGNILKQARRH